MTWLLTIVSLIGNYLNSKKIIAGFYVWIGCNIGWLIYDIMDLNTARCILDIVQTAFCVFGIIHWKEKGEKNEQNPK